MKKTSYHSYSTGTLPKGCRLCVQGRKTVVFITGICPKSCYYCPISEQKYKTDVVYINEWPTRKEKDLFEEIRLCSSKGAGITGGDPLARLDRTVRYIKLMKKKFGRSFHIHLYTPLDLVTDASLRKLHSAGLDEIRFHPDLDKPKEWSRMLAAREFKWDMGIEIPAIPGRESLARKLIDYSAPFIDFLNLNELEISDTNAQHLLERGFRPKDRLSYGVKGSEALAKRLLSYAEKNGIRTHYCTSKLKDRVQLAKRIRLRARNARKPYDYVTEEGMLVRGALYIDGSLAAARRKLLARKIRSDRDPKRGRLLLSVDDARKNARFLSSVGELRIVEEYPTFDCFSIQSVPLLKSS